MLFKRLSKKEKEEALFLGYDEIIQRRVKKIISNYKEELPKEIKVKLPDVFNHYISDAYFKENKNNINNTAFSSKQVVIKTLSNLEKKGFENALSYVIRNSNEDYVINEFGERLKCEELLEDWGKDFKNKKNAKDVWHLCFSVNESFSERSINILEESVREVLQKNFGEYKFAYVTHLHQNKPHIHVLVNKNNIFTGKKLHLKKDEFKNFFNTLRTDFAFCLNQRGLQYHNRFRLENDLTKIKEKLEKNEFLTKKNLNEELTALQESIHRKMEAKTQKIEKITEYIAELKNERKEFIKKIEGFKEEKEKNNSIDYKEFSNAFKSLKEMNENIALKFNEMKTIQKEFNTLAKDFKKIDYERLKYRDDFQSLEKKKSYLNFILNNTKKYYSVKDLELIKELRRDLILLDEKINKDLKENIKASLVVSTLLNKNNTAFDLIKSYKELDTNLNALKRADAQKENLNSYQKRLQSNQALILELIHQRYLSLEKEMKNKEKNIKFFQFKEYEKLSLFLNKNNIRELKELEKLFESKQNNAKTTKEIQKDKDKKQEYNEAKDNKRNSASALQALSQNQKLHYIENALDLSELEKKAFISFLIEKRGISNKSFYENLFLEQLNKNELKDFKELYREFLMKQKIGEKQM